jgi:uncharacterized repeat protein (TIGR01451 family)
MNRFLLLLLAALTAFPPHPLGATETTTGAASADLSVTKMSFIGPSVQAGNNITYAINVNNAGPSNAAAVTLSDMLPAGTTFQSLMVPAGWSCTTPAVGSNGTVSCSIASLPPGTSSFALTLGITFAVPHDTMLSNTAMVGSTTADPAPGNESSTASIRVSNLLASLDITKSDTPDPVAPGGNITYTITASNNGAGTIDVAGFSEIMPAGTTFVSLTVPAGWSCNPPPVGVNLSFGCTTAAWAPGNSAVFTLVLQVSPSTPLGTTIRNSVHLGANDGGDILKARIASATTQVLSPAAVSGTKTASGSFTPGSTVTYTVVLSNAGPAAQADNPGNEFTDVLPSSLTLVSATATSGTAVATVGTNTVTWNGSIPASGSVTITITATVSPAAAPGTTISNQGNFSYDADGNGTNEASGVTDNPATAGPDATSFVVAPGAAGPSNIPTLDEVGLALLALLLGMGGAVMLRRRA